jgi:hypothetical protein
MHGQKNIKLINLFRAVRTINSYFCEQLKPVGLWKEDELRGRNLISDFTGLT